MARAPMSLQVKGLKELQRTLRKLPRATGRAAVRRALKKGARPVLDEARRLVPAKTGQLRDSLTTRSAGGGREGVAIRVGPSGPAARYAHLVEFGTAPHVIRARHARSLAIGPVLVGKAVQHPGARPRPFLRPALDAKQGEAARETGRALAVEVEKTARRFAKRGRR